jgi:REP element-mobilizing transposase RayT
MTRDNISGFAHLLIAIPPKYSVTQIMGYLKGKSSLMIFDRHVNLKYQYGNRHKSKFQTGSFDT